MEQQIITESLKASPENTAVYGLLVGLLTVAIVYLISFIKSWIEDYKNTTRNVISNNTEAFNRFNDNMVSEKKREDETHNLILTLISNVNHLIQNQESAQEAMLNKVIIANKQMVEEIANKKNHG